MSASTLIAVALVGQLGAAGLKDPTVNPVAVASSSSLVWKKFPPVPDREGFGGMFAGTSDDALLAAGGANFPGKPPWEGGAKVWYDTIYVLESPKGTWRTAKEKLPRPLAYGVSVSWRGGMICAGGSDRERHYEDVFALQLVDGQIVIEQLPPLPQPCAHMCGSLAGSKFYVAGGMTSPQATSALHTFWSMDLAVPKDAQRWQKLEPWPGPDRSQSISASLGGSFLLFSGFRWKAGEKGEPIRTTPFLADAYRYTPDERDGNKGSWRRLADLPRALGAGPSPALADGTTRVFITGGVDDSADHLDRIQQPGFPLDVFLYDASQDKWSSCEPMPPGASRLTTNTTIWRGQYIIVNGESAAARRSPDVYAVQVGHEGDHESNRNRGE